MFANMKTLSQAFSETTAAIEKTVQTTVHRSQASPRLRSRGPDWFDRSCLEALFSESEEDLRFLSSIRRFAEI
ncbi:hypothetical protein ACET3Z_000430 [Daucus carota]